MKLIDIAADVLKVSVEDLNRDSCSKNVEEWTSLRHMMLISSIEQMYHIRFSIVEMKKLRTLGDFESILLKKGINDAKL